MAITLPADSILPPVVNVPVLAPGVHAGACCVNAVLTVTTLATGMITITKSGTFLLHGEAKGGIYNDGLMIYQGPGFTTTNALVSSGTVIFK